MTGKNTRKTFKGLINWYTQT